MNKGRANKLVYTIVVLYNLLGVITLCSFLGSSSFFGELTFLSILFTLPIVFISLVCSFTHVAPLYLLSIIQFIILFISLLVTRNLLKYYSK